MQDSAPPTTDRLRKDIDAGRTGEKVEFPDPAAAPLGTDAEAGGQVPRRAELEREDVQKPSAHAMDLGWPAYLAIAGTLLVAIALIVLNA